MLNDGFILLHDNTHTARQTQESLQRFKWYVWSRPPYLAPNLGSKQLSETMFSSDSDVKRVDENWLNGQGCSPVCTQPAQLLSWHQTRGQGAAFCHYRCDCGEDSMKYHFRLMEAWEDKAGDRKKMGLPTALVA
ncbi:hypothetical protein AVEN_79302-1 [Araneus ventricosus]|uniref:Uncharacterized protein n=1 Tax=Araneus ventricosus TaxID=182803 RepID=A0A4Y2PKW9_ARAVE|nr:hypothetical protein AVEN_79302-1 [Araneus ventricosus]